MKSKKKNVSLVGALIVALVLGFNFLVPADVIVGKVVKVADGDTITVLDSSNVQHKIRFQHIDTPERKQAYGQKAKDYLSRLVAGKVVEVKVKKKDRYKRNVVMAFLDGENIGLEMVQAGYAWHYKKYSKDEDYSAAEEEARKKKIGLWADPKPVPPWEFRRRK